MRAHTSPLRTDNKKTEEGLRCTRTSSRPTSTTVGGVCLAWGGSVCMHIYAYAYAYVWLFALWR